VPPNFITSREEDRVIVVGGLRLAWGPRRVHAMSHGRF